MKIIEPSVELINAPNYKTLLTGMCGAASHEICWVKLRKEEEKCRIL